MEPFYHKLLIKMNSRVLTFLAWSVYQNWEKNTRVSHRTFWNKKIFTIESRTPMLITNTILNQ